MALHNTPLDLMRYNNLMAQGIPTPIPDLDALATRHNGHIGHPTKCTDALIAAIEPLLSQAGYPTTVLEMLDVSGECHSKWVDYAIRDATAGMTDAESVFIRYSKAVKRAVAAREHSLASVVASAALAGPQYWPAGMTYLERRHPDRWGKREDGRGAGGTPSVQVQIINVHSPDGVRQQVTSGPGVELLSPPSTP